MKALPTPPRDIGITTLDNGIRVVTETMTHVRSVSVGVWITSGSRGESSEENGLSHFIEHMLFKGTRRRSAEDISRTVDSMGGHLDAFTTKEMVCYNTKVIDEQLPAAFDVLGDMVRNPLFRPEDIERERGVILEEMKMEEDNPDYLIHEIFTSNFWRDHPLGRPIIGRKDSVGAFDREGIRRYYSRIYTPANMLITAAGNLRHEQLVDLARQNFDSMKPKRLTRADKAPKTYPGIILRNKKSLEQVHVCLGVPAYPIPHERRFGAYVLNTVLGGGMSSRLFQNIREQRGLAYAVFSEVGPYRDTGCLTVYAGTSVNSVHEVLRLILAEFRDLKENHVTVEELQRAKDHLKGSLMLGLESTSSRMSNLARQQIYFDRFFDMDELLASIDAVTAEEVRSIANEFFRSEKIILSILGNLGRLKVTQSHLVC